MHRFSRPKFWDGFAQAFDVTGGRPPYNARDDRSLDLYTTLVHDWLMYGAQTQEVLEQHVDKR